MARARCLCGAVVWEAEPPFQLVHDCHCGRCRKIHGGASATMAAVPRERLRWLQGEGELQSFSTAPGSRRSFCRHCGSPAPVGEFEGLRFFPIGPLEGDFEAVSEGHIFVASKAPWHDVTDGLPSFDAYPPGVDSPVFDDLPRAPATPGSVGGSCLCGDVAWQFEGKPLLMRYCHCLRCRRARAAAYAANAMVARAAFRWTRGGDRPVVYKLPEAERFSQAFCPRCGGKTPVYLDAREAWVVPLGALDDDPGARPSEHIFVGSKAHWLRITDELPRFEAYPEG